VNGTTGRYADTVPSFPIYDGMTDEEAEYVIKVINEHKD